MRLTGKIAVVTGASRGIGLAISRALAAEGCDLALAARNAAALQSAAKALPGEVFAHACDVRDEQSVKTFFAVVRQRFGRVDILINNAGNSHRLVNVEDFPLETW